MNELLDMYPLRDWCVHPLQYMYVPFLHSMNTNGLIFVRTGLVFLVCCTSYLYTVELRWSGIMAKIFGVFGTKTCSFIKENRTKNGPLVFRTVLCSRHDEKLGNCQRKTL